MRPIREHESTIRRALFDPGAFTGRERTKSDYGGWDYEPLHVWQMRAVIVALEATEEAANL